MKATIKDVAKVAGVSIATVSNVITGKKKVGPEVTERVYQAMEVLDYKPNNLARSLKTSHSFTIGVVVPDVTTPFVSEILKSISCEAENLGYQVMICNSDQDVNREREILRKFENVGVDGIINILSILDSEKMKKTITIPMVMVATSQFYIDGNVMFLSMDDYLSGKIAAKHLLDKGNEFFGCIAGPVNSKKEFQKRLEGFQDALDEYGLSNCNLITYLCNDTFEDGYLMMKEYLDTKKGHEKIAFYITSDYMAWGAVEACNERNVKIPDEIAIVGNDNIWCTHYIHKGLTTIDHLPMQFGKDSVDELVSAVKEGSFSVKHKVLKPTICVRKTT